MVLNALGFVGRALYLMPDYLHNKPVDLLIDPELNPDDFNDDTLGRCLEDLYQAGVTEVFYRVAAQALKTYGIEPIAYIWTAAAFICTGRMSRKNRNEKQSASLMAIPRTIARI